MNDRLPPFGQIGKHAIGILDAVFPCFVCINDVIFDFGNGICHPACLFQTHCHESGRIGIGGHTIVGDDGRAQDALFRRITGARIDGMGIFLAVFDIIVPIVA